MNQEADDEVVRLSVTPPRCYVPTPSPRLQSEHAVCPAVREHLVDASRSLGFVGKKSQAAGCRAADETAAVECLREMFLRELDQCAVDEREKVVLGCGLVLQVFAFSEL